MSETTALIGVLVLLANLGVLALNLKLYTEYFKDRSQATRGARPPEPRTSAAEGHTREETTDG